MKIGIIGLPNVGKSTLFNAITNSTVDSANYPFCTIEPNVGVVSVPDERLDWLDNLYHSQKYTPATVEFVDIAGLVKGASKGEGLGNKFLGHIREVDSIVHVVRCFDDEDIVHVDGSVNPVRDVEEINYELIFSDMEVIEKRIEKIKKIVNNDKSYTSEYEALNYIYDNLEKGICIRNIDIPENYLNIVNSFNLLTIKPVIYVANISESEIDGSYESNQYYVDLKSLAAKEKSSILPICAQLESEISQLDNDERIDFLKDLGLNESGLQRLIRLGYKTLGLISFLTAGPQEVRAWTIKQGTKAPQAAGKIHSDFERGFIRAEIVSFEDLKKYGSIVAAKEKGLYRSEGKDYVVKDGDVILFRFNV